MTGEGASAASASCMVVEAEADESKVGLDSVQEMDLSVKENLSMTTKLLLFTFTPLRRVWDHKILALVAQQNLNVVFQMPSICIILLTGVFLRFCQYTCL